MNFEYGIISTIPESRLPKAKLELLAMALNVQSKHVYQHWGRSHSVKVYDSPLMPQDTIPIWIKDDIGLKTEKGFHFVELGKPYVYIKYQTDFDELSLTMSHEVCETDLNPYITNFAVTENLEILNRKGEPYFEICDICQSKQYGYRINGVLVSNFVTPPYYYPDSEKILGIQIQNRNQYDYLGLVSKPGEILEGGYKSWRLSDSETIQAFKVQGVMVYKKFTGDQEVVVTAQSTPLTWMLPVFLAFLGFFFWLFKR